MAKAALASLYGETNRVKVTLRPVGVNGKPFEVSSSGKARPDGGVSR